MFVYLCLLSHFLIHTCHTDVLPYVWDDYYSCNHADYVGTSNNKEVSGLVKHLSQNQFSSTVKTNAWYQILKNRPVETISKEDWESLEALIPFMPIEILLRVNFTDESILKYFGTLELQERHLSLVAEILFLKWGSETLKDEKRILMFGNIFCGFSPEGLARVDIMILRSLLKKHFFQKIKGCAISHLKTLVNLVQSYVVLGPPRTWTSETVQTAGILLAGLNEKQLRQIRSSSFKKISPDVVNMIPVDVLKEMRVNQLRGFNKPSLMAWRRKTQDLTPLHSGAGLSSSQVYLTASVFIHFLSTK